MMYHGRHRLTMRRGRRAAVAAGCGLLAGSLCVVPLASTAAADTGVTFYTGGTPGIPPTPTVDPGSLTGVTIYESLPGGGQVTVTPPPINDGGCVKTPDTGWACPVQTAEDNTIGPGALPGATDPEAFTVDPVAEAAKDQYAAQTAPTIDEYLALGVNEPIPAEGDIPMSPTPHQPPGGSGPGRSGAAAIAGYDQGDTPWCLPAATATVLSAWGISSTLSSVAKAEGTTDKGTPMGNARPYLNKRESDVYYRFDAAGSISQVFNHAADDIGGYGAPMIIAVSTRALTWWNGSPRQGLHALTIYSYYSESSGGFHVWDSGKNTSKGISLSATWTAMGANGAADGEIW